MNEMRYRTDSAPFGSISQRDNSHYGSNEKKSSNGGPANKYNTNTLRVGSIIGLKSLSIHYSDDKMSNLKTSKKS